MDTTTQHGNFLNSMLENYHFTQNNLHRREFLIQNFERLKPTVPFSQRLNNWITDFYENNKSTFVFTNEDDFDPNNLDSNLIRFKERYEKTGKIHIWTGASENSIFGEDPLINSYFRCWHDYIHINHSLSFDFQSETILASIQCSMLPVDWMFERELIMVEILAQAQYHHIHGEFLKNQRKFTIEYLKSPLDAIFKMQV